MTDEHKLLRGTDRAAKAQALINNELLQEAFGYLEKTFIDAWKRCEDFAMRDELWRSQANLANLRQQLGKVLNDGKLAQRELDELEKTRKRFNII